MTINLPAELMIWNQMTSTQRYAIMQVVGYHRGQSKYFRACITYIREHLSEFAA